MADEVGSLVVRLALENGSFSKGMQSLQRQMKGLESDFKASLNSSEKFGAGLTGLQNKEQYLTSAIGLQKTAVQAYANQLDQTKVKLADNVRVHEELAQRLTSSKNAYADQSAALRKSQAETESLKKTVDALEKEYSEAAAATDANADSLSALAMRLENAKAAYAESAAATDKAAKETTDLKTATDKLKSEYDTCERTIRKNNESIEKLTIEYNDARGALGKLEGDLSKTQSAIVKQASAWERLRKAANTGLTGLGKASAKVQEVGRDIKNTGQTILRASAPLIAAGGYALKTSIDFESAWTGVLKTVDATEEQLAGLRQGIIDMSKEIPSSAKEIAGVAEAAGQLGIEVPNLLSFTRVMIDLGQATNLSADEAAMSLAKFANITQMSQKDFSRLGSTIVDLGNNMATTEADIVSMAMRLAGAGKQIGLSQSQILGISAALSSVGIEAEAGGSAFSKVFVQMQLAVETGKDGLKDFAKVAGMSGKQFQEAFKKDAGAAITAFIAGLSRMDEKGVSAIKTLSDMGLTEVRLRDALLRSSNSAGLFADAMNIANKGWSQNSALAEEAAKRYGTTASRLEILKNKADAVAMAFGETIAPYLEKALELGSELIEQFGSMEEEQRNNVLSTGGLVVGAGLALTAVGSVVEAVGSIGKGISNVGQGAVWLAGKLGPKGVLAVAAIAGMATLVNAIYGPDKALQALNDKLQNTKLGVTTEDVELAQKTIQDALNAGAVYQDVLVRMKAEGGSLHGQMMKILTDGKPESKKEIEEYLNKPINKMVDDAAAAIKANTANRAAEIAGEISKIGTLTDDQKKSISSGVNEQGEKLLGDMKGYADEYTKIVEGIVKRNEKPTEEEILRMQKLMDKIAEVRAQIDLLDDQTRSYNTALVDTVKQGGGTIEMGSQAVALEFQSTELKKSEIRAKYQEEIAKLQAALDNASGGEDSEALKAEIKTKFELRDKDLAQVDAEYAKSIDDIFAGLARQFPGAVEQLKQAAEDYDVLKKIQSAILTAQESEESPITAEFMKSIGLDPNSGNWSWELEVKKQELVDRIATTMGNPDLSTAFATFGGAMREGLLKNIKPEDMQGTLEGLFKLVDLGQRGMEIGESLNTGMTQGEQSNSDDPVKQACVTMMELVTGAKGVVQSKSPSKVFMKIGRDIMEGLRLGIDRNWRKALYAISPLKSLFNNAGRDMVKSIIQGVQSQQSALNSKLRELARQALAAAYQELNNVTPPQAPPTSGGASSYSAGALSAAQGMRNVDLSPQDSHAFKGASSGASSASSEPVHVEKHFHFHIGQFVNERRQSIEAFLTEAEYLARRREVGTGGAL